MDLQALSCNAQTRGWNVSGGYQSSKTHKSIRKNNNKKKWQARQADLTKSLLLSAILLAAIDSS